MKKIYITLGVVAALAVSVFTYLWFNPPIEGTYEIGNNFIKIRSVLNDGKVNFFIADENDVYVRCDEPMGWYEVIGNNKIKFIEAPLGPGKNIIHVVEVGWMGITFKDGGKERVLKRIWLP